MSPPPSPRRYYILALLCALAMITYMDRAANGSAKKAIMAELNVEQVEQGLKPYVEDDFFIVLMAFQLAYALFEIPSGWLGDTKGPRSTLLRVVVWWSVFVALSALTGLRLPVFGYVGLVALTVIQFLFGVGEAGAFPNISKALYNWFPANQRGFAKSIIWSSARFMGGMTPFLWILITSENFAHFTWRQALLLFAGVAALWCVVFFFTFQNKPKEAIAPTIKPAPVKVPWGTLLRSRNLWALCGMYIVTNFCWYFLMYNLPGKLKEFYEGPKRLADAGWKPSGLEELTVALLSGLPLVIGMFGCFLGGSLSDLYIARTGNRKWGRRIFGMFGYGMAGVCYLLAAWAYFQFPGNFWPFAILLIAMGFFNDLIMAPAWAVAQDIGQQYAATVSGAMNMVGNLVGAVSGIFFTGMVMKSTTIPEPQKILICFSTYAAVYFVGVLLWMLIDPTKPVAPAPANDAEAR